MLADPSPVDSSVSAGGDRQSPSRKIGGSTGDRFRSRSSRSSPLRGRDVHEERRCARSRSTDRLQLRGRRRSRRDSSRSPSARVRSRRYRSRSSDFYWERRVDDCARIRLAVVRPGMTARGHTGPAIGHVTVAGLVTALLLTARGLGGGFGGLDGVAGIARSLWLLPAIAAALDRQWCPPLLLRVAPPLFPRPPSRTSSGWFSACLGPWHSGMQL